MLAPSIVAVCLSFCALSLIVSDIDNSIRFHGAVNEFFADINQMANTNRIGLALLASTPYDRIRE